MAREAHGPGGRLGLLMANDFSLPPSSSSSLPSSMSEKETTMIVDFWIVSESSNGDVFTKNSFTPEMNP